MMVKTLGVLGLTLALAAPLRAQDTVMVEGPRAAQLRRAIEARFADRLAVELGLNDDQATKVTAVLSRWAARRRVMETQEQQVRRDLARSMRPGVAANDAEVNGLVDKLLDSRAAYVQTFRDELADLSGILTAVQRAQYLLLPGPPPQRVEDLRNQRADPRPVPSAGAARPSSRRHFG
ncbi:MAG: Spy/CpxP family protein refolding chaperone [Gemmatimonadales bacterium]